MFRHGKSVLMLINSPLGLFVLMLGLAYRTQEYLDACVDTIILLLIIIII